jgi:cell division protein FtsB
MAYLNRQFAYNDAAYPELSPVTARPVRRHLVQSHQKKRTSHSERLLYTAVIGALVFGLVQCARTLIGDSLSLSRLAHSKASVEQFYEQTRNENRQLNEKIRLYSSAFGIEELARNYLNMVGKDEIPVRFQ